VVHRYFSRFCSSSLCLLSIPSSSTAAERLRSQDKLWMPASRGSTATSTRPLDCAFCWVSLSVNISHHNSYYSLPIYKTMAHNLRIITKSRTSKAERKYIIIIIIFSWQEVDLLWPRAAGYVEWPKCWASPWHSPETCIMS